MLDSKCPHCGEDMILDPFHGKIMVHREYGNIFCQYGVVERNQEEKPVEYEQVRN